jgi:hypothetical protein
MLDEWRDNRTTRLERELTSLRSDMWDLDAQVRERFWERDQRDRERKERRLDFMMWVLVGLMWATAGATIAVVAVKAG